MPNVGVWRHIGQETSGAGMHYTCLEVDDIAGTMRRLTEHGVELLSETPKVNEHGVKYCLVHPKSALGVLVELYEKPS
jgi:catechol 2,3-dioxygenase-like lactoylglutathione lyase family enzyme